MDARIFSSCLNPFLLSFRVVSEKSLFRAEGKICLRFPSSVQGDKKIVEGGGSVSRTGENLG
jgi:hypothetical protein